MLPCAPHGAFAVMRSPRCTHDGTGPLAGPQWHTPLMDTLDPRLSSPAALRNRQPILEALRQVLPPAGLTWSWAIGPTSGVMAMAVGPAPTATGAPAVTPGLVRNGTTAGVGPPEPFTVPTA